jgi:hypothetical protein
VGLILLIAGAALAIVKVYNAVRSSNRFDNAIHSTRQQAGVIFQIADVVLRIVDVLLGARVSRPQLPQGAPVAVRFGQPAALASAEV